MELVKSFCEKTLHLKAGEPRAFGPSEEVTAQYVKDMSKA
jgi:ABC-type polysaccharide/polyol phosphate transport system ATPase subunit